MSYGIILLVETCSGTFLWDVVAGRLVFLIAVALGLIIDDDDDDTGGSSDDGWLFSSSSKSTSMTSIGPLFILNLVLC